jgi:RNA polymerase sigma-70 factor (ECF subfamily)
VPRDSDDLVRRATAGDDVAIGELLVRHLPQLEAFLRLRMGPALAAKESVSDLAQSVCRELLEGASDFAYRGEAEFRRWLFLHAWRRLVSRARHWNAERRDAGPAPPPTQAEAMGAISLLTPSRDAIAQEELEAFTRALDALPEAQREVLALCRGLGMTPSEAAAELGKTPNAVRVTLHRALAKLAVLEDALLRG